MKSIVESARGLVQLGAFAELLNIPGKYLNDHCFMNPVNPCGWAIVTRPKCSNGRGNG